MFSWISISCPEASSQPTTLNVTQVYEIFLRQWTRDARCDGKLRNSPRVAIGERGTDRELARASRYQIRLAFFVKRLGTNVPVALLAACCSLCTCWSPAAHTAASFAHKSCPVTRLPHANLTLVRFAKDGYVVRGRSLHPVQDLAPDGPS